MSNLTVIENKISSIQKYLKILERYKNYSREELENNIDIRGAAERYLYLVSQAAIDLAEAVIAYKNSENRAPWPNLLISLKKKKIISDELVKKMIGMVGFRNIVAHDYEKINYDLVYRILHQDIEDIRKFIERVAKI